MALDLSSLRPKVTEMAPRQGTRARRDLGPNPFLDKEWPYNLQNSYDQGEAYSIEVAGERVEDVIHKGPRKGEPTTRLTGDAADAVVLVREAANLLGIGVSVQDSPAGRKGFVKVSYQGQKRKQKREANPAPEVTTDTAE